MLPCGRFQMMKKILPIYLRRFIRQIIKSIRYWWRQILIKRAVKKNKTLKIILGAAETSQQGWYSTNEQWLDIAKSDDWGKIFNKRYIVKNMVAEHVLEHLNSEDVQSALRNIHKHLIENGRLRIAVPDGYNPSEEYIEHVKVGGCGDDAEDHKQLFNRDSISKLLKEAGFEQVLIIEGYDAEGKLTVKEWGEQNGYIRRSRQNLEEHNWSFPDACTSLIVDAIK